MGAVCEGGMTNREKRHWARLDVDWRDAAAMQARGELITVEYSLDDGKPVIPDDASQAVIVQCAAAIDYAYHGLFTGSVTVPRTLWDRCQRETVKQLFSRPK